MSLDKMAYCTPDSKSTFTCVWLAWVCALGVLIAGCGESKLRRNNTQAPADAGDTGTDVPGPEPELQDFAFDTSRAMCEKMFECCSAEELQSELGLNAEDVDECVDQGAFFSFVFGYSQLDDSVKAGRIEVDPSMTELCAESIAETSCAEMADAVSLQAEAPGCREVFQPQVAQGEECAIDQDCITGFCYKHDAESVPTCKELPQQGEDCPALRCDDGLYCDTFDFVCQPARANGESCLSDGECESQNCDTDADGNQTCAAPEALCGG